MIQNVEKILKKCIRIIRRFYGVGYKEFGEGSIIRKPMRILGKSYITIGKSVDIMNGIRLEAICKWGGGIYEPSITIKDNVTIGQNCHITCANEVLIGKGTTIMPDTIITDIEHEYVKGKSSMATGLSVGNVRIGENVTIGAGTRIFGRRGITIGNNSVIGANSVVTKSIGEGAVAVGIPAREVRYL